jgi:hypothetical protein
MDKYQELVKERNAMKQVIDSGRKGTVYHTQAMERYKKAVVEIKNMFRQQHKNER